MFLSAPTALALPGFDGVALRCEFERAAFQPAAFGALGIHCPDGLRQAVPKRQAEYLAGRYCVQAALRQLGEAAVDVLSAADRAPCWPPGLTGSISHHGSSACCAVTHRARCGGVGIDVETCMDAESAALHAPLLLDAPETALLHSQEARFEWLVTLSFSAKESLFKAVYPAIRIYFDFLDARIVGLDLEDRWLVLELKRTLGAGMHAGRRFRIHYQATARDILTATWF